MLLSAAVILMDIDENRSILKVFLYGIIVVLMY